MDTRSLFLAAVVIVGVAIPIGAELDKGGEPEVALAPFAEGFNQPVQVVYAPGDFERVYVVEKPGSIIEVDIVTKVQTVFLDIESRVRETGNEQGLLSLVFHPDYQSNGYFYVYYTRADEDMQLSRFEESDGAKVGDPGSEFPMLVIPQGQSIHNGGTLLFGPSDGYLYLGTGDGRGGEDPLNSAQSLFDLRGKILRLDVDGGSPYASPEDNPFFGPLDNARDEVWAYGLRNPWRMSFDRATGDLYVGDVGQGTHEEINVQPSASEGGENYGWRIAEGFACRGGGGTCGTNAGFTPPLLDFTRDEARAITGGYVYRGGAAKAYQGLYVFGDYVRGHIWTLRYTGSGFTELQEHSATLDPDGNLANNVSSFGEDAVGNIYLCSIGEGLVYRFEFGADTVPQGDVNQNGVVDIIDLQLVVNAVLFFDIGDLDADVNGDGDVNIKDINFTVKIILNRT